MMPRPASMPRVLLVAPAVSNLPFVEKEIQRVTNALHPRLLFGDVTLEKLLDEEEEIARRTHGGAAEAPHFRGED